MSPMHCTCTTNNSIILAKVDRDNIYRTVWRLNNTVLAEESLCHWGRITILNSQAASLFPSYGFVSLLKTEGGKRQAADSRIIKS